MSCRELVDGFNSELARREFAISGLCQSCQDEVFTPSFTTPAIETAKEIVTRAERILARARRMGRIRDGLVLCDTCDTPASLACSIALAWTCCGPCATGEADSFNPDDLIVAL